MDSMRFGIEAPHIGELKIDPKSFTPVHSEGTPKVVEEHFTPTQVRLAKILSDAWTKQQDSSDFKNVTEAKPVDLGQVEGLHVIDSASRRVEFEGKQFTLPKEWAANKETNTISVLPGEKYAGKQIIGASPKTLSVLSSTTKNVKPSATTPAPHFSNAPAAHEVQKPLTAAQIQEQQEQTQRAQQAAAAAAARKTEEAQETKNIVQNKKATKRPAESSAAATPVIKKIKSSIDEASEIISNQKSMSEAIDHAVGTAKTKTTEKQAVDTAAFLSAAALGGQRVSGTNADNDARQQNQQGRQEAAFQQEEVHAQQSVGSSKAGQGVPGKSKK